MGLEANWPKGYKTGRRQLFTVLDKMIMQDVMRTLLAVLTVIVVIIVSRQFIRVLDKAIEGQVSNETLLTILGLKIIVASVSFLPASLFMTVLMVLGRMYRDQEMAAISSAGGGSGIIYRALFLLIFPLSVLATGLSMYVAPWAEARIEQLMHEDTQSTNLRGIGAGKFSEYYSEGDVVVYVENVSSDKKMHKVFVQSRQSGNLAIVTAEEGKVQELNDGRYIVLENGERIQGLPGSLNYVIEQFVEYAVRIEEKSGVIDFDRAAVPAAILWKSGSIRDTAELQHRFSTPLGLILLSFIAVPLAQISPRGGVYGNMLVGFLIYFSYGNLSRVSESWVMNETIPAWLGGIGVNVLLLLAGGILLARFYGWTWIILKFKEKVAR
ncbi:MAG: LPS export ABC transporter permease LptF [Methylobacter sp.]|nr:LPS export ABC transporter permease LptF [Methylobacter sp.]